MALLQVFRANDAFPGRFKEVGCLTLERAYKFNCTLQAFILFLELRFKILILKSHFYDDFLQFLILFIGSLLLFLLIDHLDLSALVIEQMIEIYRLESRQACSSRWSDDGLLRLLSHLRFLCHLRLLRLFVHRDPMEIEV